MSYLVSIIIASKNSSSLLELTLQSIRLQNISDVEVIIQDCLSNDDTIKIAQKYIPSSIAGTIVSEEDSGIYDAWNRSLNHISGKWVLFMGAGDTFLKVDSLENVLHILKHILNEYQYYSLPVVTSLPENQNFETVYPSSNPMDSLRDGMCMPHQGLFHRADLFKEHKFDIRYRIAGDYEFLCRTITRTNVHFGNDPCVRMLLGGVSSDMRFMLQREKEFWHISRRYFPGSFPLKILLRMLRAYAYALLLNIFGRTIANAFADIPRLIRSKPRLWSAHADLKRENCLPLLQESVYISLIIPTLNRRDELHRLLESLRAQTYRAFQVQIADQNGDGYFDDLIAEFSDLDVAVRRMPSKGVSIARNALLPLAGGDIIAFPDDDCWYPPDTLENVVAAFRRYPEAGGIIGLWASEPSRFATNPLNDAVITERACFSRAGTCVQFFRSEAVKAAGPFDTVLGPGTDLPYGCGEDTDYLLRVREAGFPVRRVSSVHVFHPEPADSYPSPEKVNAYAAGRMYLLKKHAFPLWFRLANILYPLLRLPFDGARHGIEAVKYRWRMFIGRLRNF